MSIFDAFVLGIVEGITEFLPISSTAHLMMTARVLGLNSTEFLKSFEIVIQFGAIAAVLFVFGPRFLKNYAIWRKVVIAFVPTAVIGFLVYKLVKDFLLGNLAIAAWSLIIGGLIFIAFEYYLTKHPERQTGTIESISDKQALVIGLVQSLAIIPGVSRAAATIIPALFFKASRKAATEFSFLLAVPTVAAAASYDLLKNFTVINGNAPVLIVGFVVSFIAAILTIKFILYFVARHTFTPFGIYRIIIAILFLTIFV